MPEKLSQAELVSRGFKSGNHRAIIPIMKFIKFVDESGKPTQNWVNYRDKGQSGRVMASCLRVAYNDLFRTYPNAQDKDTEALRNFFSTRVTAGQKVLDLTVTTFRALCELADFRGEQIEVMVPEGGEEGKSKGVRDTTSQPSPTGLTINLNIQLTLPATENAEIYDKIFAAMRKNLIVSRT